jgi:hypothetical protein
MPPRLSFQLPDSSPDKWRSDRASYLSSPRTSTTRSVASTRGANAPGEGRAGKNRPRPDSHRLMSLDVADNVPRRDAQQRRPDPQVAVVTQHERDPTYAPRSSLATVVPASAAPYGYTLAIWSCGAVLLRSHGTPSFADTLMFVAGAIAGFNLLGLMAIGAIRRARPNRAPPGSRACRASYFPFRSAGSLSQAIRPPLFQLPTPSPGLGRLPVGSP